MEQEVSQADLVDFLDIVYGALRRNDFDYVNELFVMIDDDAAMVVKVSLLRSTYTARSLLSNWNPYLKRLHDDLVAKGENPVRLLTGLYEEPSKPGQFS